MNPLQEERLLMNRRHFFGRTAVGLGAAALGSLLNPGIFLAGGEEAGFPIGKPHFAAKAERVIYLFMAGGPSQCSMRGPGQMGLESMVTITLSTTAIGITWFIRLTGSTAW